MPPRRDKKKLRFGMVAVGSLYRFGYAPWLKAFLRRHRQQIELVGLCDTNRQEVARHAGALGVPAFTDHEQLLERARPHAVIINSPHWLHAPHTLAAAQAGAHVLCEKPMAPTAREAADMVAACKKAGVRLQIGLVRRFVPAFQTLRHLLQQGELGEVVDLEIDWPYYMPDFTHSPYREALEGLKQVTGYDLLARFGAWRLSDPKAGGGNFMDHGPHCLDLMQFWSGPIDRVLATSRPLVPGRNEDFTRSVAHFKNGALGFVTTTVMDFKAPVLGEVRGFVRGERGRVDWGFDLPFLFLPIHKLVHYCEPEQTWLRLPLLLGGRGKALPQKAGNIFEDQLAHFLFSLPGMTRPPHPLFGHEDFATSGEEGLRLTQMIEAAYASSREGAVWKDV